MAADFCLGAFDGDGGCWCRLEVVFVAVVHGFLRWGDGGAPAGVWAVAEEAAPPSGWDAGEFSAGCCAGAFGQFRHLATGRG